VGVLGLISIGDHGYNLRRERKSKHRHVGEVLGTYLAAECASRMIMPQPISLVGAQAVILSAPAYY
jgi:hypothetical protein